MNFNHFLFVPQTGGDMRYEPLVMCEENYTIDRPQPGAGEGNYRLLV